MKKADFQLEQGERQMAIAGGIAPSSCRGTGMSEAAAERDRLIQQAVREGDALLQQQSRIAQLEAAVEALRDGAARFATERDQCITRLTAQVKALRDIGNRMSRLVYHRTWALGLVNEWEAAVKQAGEGAGMSKDERPA